MELLVASTVLSSRLACQEPASPADREMPSYADTGAAAVSDPFTREALDRHYMPFGFVAHALGEIDGESYTNSRQAFERSYERGFRVFEADLVQLADGTVWTVHDNYEERYGLSDRFDRLTAEDLEHAKLDGMFAIYRSDVFEDPNWSDDAIVRFVADNDIDAVMMWWNHRYDPDFDRRLRDGGAAVYVHSLNDRATIVRFREAGVGVYSDGLIYP